MLWLGEPFPALELHGTRVCLRPPRLKEWADWSRLRHGSRAHLEPWEPAWQEDSLTRAAYRRRLRRLGIQWRRDEAYVFHILRREDMALVGAISLTQVRRGVAQMASVGYWIGRPFARQGYMTEALAVTLDYGFGTLGLHRIEAACLPRNDASRGVLEKVGFRPEGEARQYLKINGVWEDHLLFAVLFDDMRLSAGL